MEIYIVRHTTPDAPHDVCYGRQDVGLADSFEREAAEALDKLLQFTAGSDGPSGSSRSFPATQVYCSPLQRCARLARVLSAYPPKIDGRLIEMDFGNWEMQRWDQIPPEQMAAWEHDPVHFAPPDGETAAEMAHRARSFADELGRLDDTSRVLVVSHGGPIHMLVAALLDAPLHVGVRLHVDYASVTRIDLLAGKPKLICLNR